MVSTPLAVSGMLSMNIFMVNLVVIHFTLCVTPGTCFSNCFKQHQEELLVSFPLEGMPWFTSLMRMRTRKRMKFLIWSDCLC
jgi:hypothetical protein